MTATIDHEVEVENAHNVEVLVIPHDPEFQDQSWDLDQNGNMMAYRVSVELEWDEDNYSENISGITAIDADGEEVSHTNLHDVERVRNYISRLDLNDDIERFYR
jgi:hypothetical protein